MKVFPGINVFAAEFTRGDALLHHRVIEDGLVGEIGDLLAQAYAATPGSAPAIVQAAAERAAAVIARAELVTKVLRQAVVDLVETPAGEAESETAPPRRTKTTRR